MKTRCIPLKIRSVLCNAALILFLGQMVVFTTKASGPDPFATREPVGRLGANRLYTPTNQVLTPAGQQVELPGMRPQALALSPNGRLLVTAGKTHELVVLDPVTGAIRQRVPLPSDKAVESTDQTVSTHILEPDKEGQLSFTGLAFSPDGRSPLPRQRQRQHQGLWRGARRDGERPVFLSPAARRRPETQGGYPLRPGRLR